MNNISRALQREIGPFPAWAWIIMLTGAIWLYRNKLGGGATAQQQAPVLVPEGSSVYDPTIETLFTPGQPPTPQAPMEVQPGDSVYDPNSGNLVNTPGALLTVGQGVGSTSPNVSAAQLAAALPTGGNVTAAATPTASTTSP